MHAAAVGDQEAARRLADRGQDPAVGVQSAREFGEGMLNCRLRDEYFVFLYILFKLF